MSLYLLPNHLVRTHAGMTSFRFGRVHSVIPNSLCPHPHIEARFIGGLLVELEKRTAEDLAEQLVAALRKLPFIPEEIHDAIGLEDG